MKGYWNVWASSCMDAPSVCFSHRMRCNNDTRASEARTGVHYRCALLLLFLLWLIRTVMITVTMMIILANTTVIIVIVFLL